MKKYLWIILLFMTSCAAKKQAADFEAQPSWMKQKPIIPGYFVGIGSAKKVGTTSEYIANARKDALADLAGEVSSRISATSVYHTIENKYGITESYDQRIETTINDYLEGFEPVDQFETPDSYWVYFRISKEMYYEQKEKKKKQAVDAALAKYSSGMKEEEALRPKEALTFYLQGLQILKPYLKEETPAIYKGEKMDTGNGLFSATENLLNQLSIVPEKNEISLKRVENLGFSLRFRVLFRNIPVPGMPVEFSFSGGYLKTDQQNSGSEGWVSLEPGPIFSMNPKEKYSARLNIKEIAQKAVDDVFIRGLILKHTIEPAFTNVVIVQPALSVVIAESTCNEDECRRLVEIFEQAALKKGFQFSTKNYDYDYVYFLNYSLTPGKNAGGYVSVNLLAELRLKDKSEKQIWIKNNIDIRGVGTNPDEARSKALEELIATLGRYLINQGLEMINQDY